MNIVVLYEKNDSEIMFDNKTLFQKTLLRFKYFLLFYNKKYCHKVIKLKDSTKFPK